MTQFTYETFTGKGVGGKPPSYHISEQDALIVDMAIKLGRPLLVEGEAGCGKTTLATAIAEELNLGEPIVVPVRSLTKANDLFYRADMLRRFQDSNVNSPIAEFVQNYITCEPIGKAIVDGTPCVILIDEIDKADMDFQNDLLFALEKFEFIIDEIPDTEEAEKNGVRHRMSRKGDTKPIILFTSNQEKLLPKPFLRRCLYLELEFPDTSERLVQIVKSNLEMRHKNNDPGGGYLETLNDTTVTQAVDSFLEIRKVAQEDRAIKRPATSELLDWVHALHIHPDLAGDLSGLKPPLWEMLFRTSQDKARHANRD